MILERDTSYSAFLEQINAKIDGMAYIKWLQYICLS